jgi:hypothetical protein
MKCPGQDSRYWTEDAIFEVKCPKCDSDVEFFKDDTSRTCKKCGHRFLNPAMDFGCASYCQYAEQCIGNLPPELVAQKEDLLKDRVAIEMKRHFRKDFKRIGHAIRVARYGEEIGKGEEGNLAVILTAAYLHDIGLEEGEVKSGLESRYKKRLVLIGEILARLKAREEIIEEVCQVIQLHHEGKKAESTEFRAFHDAHLIACLEERQGEEPVGGDERRTLAGESFLTKSGKDLAKRIGLPVP